MRGLVCVLLLLSGVIALARPVQAQDIPVIDVNAIPMALRHRPLPECGVSLAADPVWPLGVERGRTGSGAPQSSYSYRLLPEFWKDRSVLSSKVYVNPSLFVNLTCFDSTLRGEEGLGRFARGMHKRARESQKRVSPLQTGQAPGVGPVAYFTSEAHSTAGNGRGRVADQGHVYALHRGRLVTLLVRVSRTPPSSYRKRLRAGAVVRLEDPQGGPPVVFRVKEPARQAASGAVSYQRSKAGNMSLIETLRKSLRGL